MARPQCETTPLLSHPYVPNMDLAVRASVPELCTTGPGHRLTGEGWPRRGLLRGYYRVWERGLPFRLNAVLQDPHVAFLLFQRQNVHVTSASLDHSCVDGSFADAGALMDKGGSEEGYVLFLKSYMGVRWLNG